MDNLKKEQIMALPEGQRREYIAHLQSQNIQAYNTGLSNAPYPQADQRGVAVESPWMRMPKPEDLGQGSPVSPYEAERVLQGYRKPR